MSVMIKFRLRAALHLEIETKYAIIFNDIIFYNFQFTYILHYISILGKYFFFEC